MPLTGIDVVALSWCLPEIRESLARARAALEAHVGAEAGTTSELKSARLHLHQAHGALQVADIAAVSVVTQEAEAILARAESEELVIDAEAVKVIGEALSAVVEYLEDAQAGSLVSPVALFPEYRAMLQLHNAERIEPADLYFPDLSIQPPARLFDGAGKAKNTDIGVLSNQARREFERGLLGFLRGGDLQGSIEVMHEALGRLIGHEVPRGARAFLWLSYALLDALRTKALPADLYVKRLVARINLQARRTLDAGDPVADRMLKDLLFQLARASDASPVAAEVRRHYGLAGTVTADFERRRYGLADPAAMAEARQAIASCRKVWEKVVRGSHSDLTAMNEGVSALNTALKRLPFEGMTSLASTLKSVVSHSMQQPEVGDGLGLEVATAILFVEEALDGGLRGDPAYDARAGQLGQRLRTLMDNPEAQDGEAPSWLIEISQKASDRITITAFVNELGGVLRTCEQTLDAYFRDPATVSQLATLDPLFAQSIGVFRSLGHNEAAHACAAVQADVRALADDLHAATDADHQRIANNLSALGFFLQSLLQPAGGGVSFVFDAERRELLTREPEPQQRADADEASPFDAEGDDEDSAASGSAESRIAAQRQAIEPWLSMLEVAPQSTDVHENLSRCLSELERDSMLIDDTALKQQASNARDLLARVEADPSDSAQVAALASLLKQLAGLGAAVVPNAVDDQPMAEDESELLEIFLMEAEEVLEAIRSTVAESRAAPSDQGHLTTIRRSFHTLKGSSRMVGLDRFGETGWAFEQVMNKWLSEERSGTAAIYDLIEAGHEVFTAWVAALANNPRHVIDTAALIRRCDALRDGVELDDAAGATDAERSPASDAASAATADAVAEATAPAAGDAHADAGDIEATGAEADIEAGSTAGTEAAADVAAEPSPMVAADVSAPAAAPGDDAEALSTPEDEITIGDRRVGRQIYEIFNAEGADLRSRMRTAFAGWKGTEGEAAPSELIRGLHSLSGASRHVGLLGLRAIAMPSERLLLDQEASQRPLSEQDMAQFGEVLDAIDTLLTEFAAGQEPGSREEVENALRGMARRWSDEDRARLQADRDRHARAEAEAQAEARAAAQAAEQARIAAEARAAEQAVEQARLEAEARAAAEAAEQAAEQARQEAEARAAEQAAEQARLEAKARAAAEAAEQAAEQARQEAEARAAAQAAAQAREALAAATPELAAATSDEPADEVTITGSTGAADTDEDPYEGLFDEIDDDLGPVFFEEADEQLPAVDGELRRWRDEPTSADAPQALMRLLHTIKGSARMAGAMRLGQMVHEMETLIEEAIAQKSVPDDLLEDLQARQDAVTARYDALLLPGGLAALDAQKASKPAAPQAKALGNKTTADKATADKATSSEPAKADDQSGSKAAGAVRDPAATSADASSVSAAASVPAPRSVAEAQDAGQEVKGAANQSAHAAQQLIRVRADLLDKMVSESGEISVARARLDNEIAVIRQSMSELAENVTRLRAQLREIEIQADTQIQTRNEQSRDARADFDPLEFDRYTRFQELARMLAESVNDVATVQQNAMRALEAATQDLSRQNQVSRSLQQHLMRVRMVQFGSVTDRLYRVVRQAGKDSDKRVRLELINGQAEIDRGVLERMMAPIEHILRNSVAHGIESKADRQTAGKADVGEIAVGVRQEGNEVILSFTDDGAGLNYARIEQRARERGLLAGRDKPSERELAQMIFAPGFSTATNVTALAGRGVGMDVVRSEVSGIGGRIDIDSTVGKGTTITVHLPVSMAVSQVVLLGVDKSRFAVQAALVERILQVKPEDLAASYETHQIKVDGASLPLFYLGSLLELSNVRPVAQRLSPVVVLRSGASKIALHVDTLVPNQEVVIKNVGPQLSRLIGVSGATVLGNGDIVLILNPVTLAHARPVVQAGLGDTASFSATEIASVATVMVVDDSVTVRKVTQRLLHREGYQVVLAKDGVDALRLLEDALPDVMLVDIEMPRMDGFDLTKAVRSTPRLASIPVIMITSRTADKHRNHAMQLGVDAFLGKPYPEDELLAHIAGFVAARRSVAP